ncbi:hypothetical protein HMPREF9446_00987 [Bacteroides fluxus YIT 12057]|jgi:hypothetical protein|uniref:Uncharacterized protein n=1 Tax=Bacteroides fluxus YIT 12057 TaxID=763034 RepID=F3PQJ3_9BACE|nr:hypothetical protein HMPREF9446_00987 [Bacteroides fluxus YIT 12057]
MVKYLLVGLLPIPHSLFGVNRFEGAATSGYLLMGIMKFFFQRFRTMPVTRFAGVPRCYVNKRRQVSVSIANQKEIMR